MIHAVNLSGTEKVVPQLTLTGTVSENDANFALGFAVAEAVLPPQSEADGAMSLGVDFLDAAGKTLLSTPVAGAPVCTLPNPDGEPLPPTYLVRSLVPLVDDIASMVVRDPGRELLRRDFPKGIPETSKLEISPNQDGYSLDWEASHPDGAPLEHVVVARESQEASWLPISLPTAENEIEVWPPDSLSGAKALQLALLTTDGLHTVLSEPVEADAPRLAPTVAIVEPRTLSASSPVALVAYTSGTGAEKIVQWNVSDDGRLLTGNELLADVSPGKHIVTATLIGKDGAPLSEDSVEIVVVD